MVGEGVAVMRVIAEVVVLGVAVEVMERGVGGATAGGLDEALFYPAGVSGLRQRLYSRTTTLEVVVVAVVAVAVGDVATEGLVGVVVVVQGNERGGRVQGREEGTTRAVAVVVVVE